MTIAIEKDNGETKIITGDSAVVVVKGGKKGFATTNATPMEAMEAIKDIAELLVDDTDSPYNHISEVFDTIEVLDFFDRISKEDDKL